jgi:hypothetical protein
MFYSKESINEKYFLPFTDCNTNETPLLQIFSKHGKEPPQAIKIILPDDQKTIQIMG